MTTQEVYNLYHDRLYGLLDAREHLTYRIVFPDTGGNGQFVHNWYVCSSDLWMQQYAVAFRNRYYERRARLTSRFYREYARAMHQEHIDSGEVGEYLWCDWCKQAVV